jgi:hypothetical protein
VVGGTTHSDASTVATLSVFTPPTLAWLGAAGSDWDTTSLNWTNLAGWSGDDVSVRLCGSALFDSRGSAAAVREPDGIWSIPSVLTANADHGLCDHRRQRRWLSGQGRLVKQGSAAN